MGTGWIMLMIAGVVAAVAMLVWARTRGGRSFSFGFRDWVRNPSLRHGWAELFAERERMVGQLAKLPPGELVELLLDDDFELAEKAIKVAGPGVVSPLVAALSDERFLKPTDPAAQEKMHIFSRRYAPVVTVMDCLSDLGPASAARGAALFARHANDEIRKHAALLLGAIGSDECVEAFATCCRDPDDYVRSYAMMGVLRGVAAGRCSEGFRVGAFRAILPLVDRKDTSVSGNAPRCLLQLDRARAVKILTQPKSIAPGREGLQYTLKALREENVPVDEALLLRLTDALESQADVYSNGSVLYEALGLLGRIHSDAAKQAIEKAVSSPSGRVREGAMLALAAREGLADPFGYAWKQLELVGWDRLQLSQRHVLAVQQLTSQVTNGGFSQYFVNSTGSRWRLALAGLKAIARTTDVATFEQALGYFGEGGPSVDDDKRHEQLAKIVAAKGDEVFSALESTFYREGDDRQVALLRYMIQHPADFKPAP